MMESPTMKKETQEEQTSQQRAERKRKKKEKKKKKKKRSRSESSIASLSTTTESKPSMLDDDDNNKKKKKRKKSNREQQSTNNDSNEKSTTGAACVAFRPLVESSNLDYVDEEKSKTQVMNVTLLLFYQYQEPPWSDTTYKQALQTVQRLGQAAGVTGRMRVAKEGLNCTLTTESRQAMVTFIQSLRHWKPHLFGPTEFKLTHHLPAAQAFSNLKIIPVSELVHYGLDGNKAPPIAQFHGQHLEPAAYHQKMTEDDTVMIDVRNHYEAQIGRFDPPAATWLDPNMRKSTEFPVWLDDEQTREKLRGKQVLMYCTGGIRCERATALLKYKMEKDPSVQALGIKGVFQLQGGIDKYFKEFPDGGYWKGKNYVFDKRFAHKPPAQDALPSSWPNGDKNNNTPLSKCEACLQPWDKFRGKRRCPTCGVPSLICKACWHAHEEGRKKLDPTIRCDLCRQQGITSKRELREKEMREIQEYERRMQAQGLLEPTTSSSSTSTTAQVQEEETTKMPPAADNPDQVTRLAMRNLCRHQTTQESLLEYFPEITHIIWRTDHRTQQFLGQAWVEMSSPQAAAQAAARSGERIAGRPIQIVYQPPNGKDIWPPPNGAIRR